MTTGAISDVSAAALVTAGVPSVALFPTAAFALLRIPAPTPVPEHVRREATP